jgi:hypothetical protein
MLKWFFGGFDWIAWIASLFAFCHWSFIWHLKAEKKLTTCQEIGWKRPNCQNEQSNYCTSLLLAKVKEVVLERWFDPFIRYWSPKERALLGTMPDEEVAARLKRTLETGSQAR